MCAWQSTWQFRNVWPSRGPQVIKVFRFSHTGIITHRSLVLTLYRVEPQIPTAFSLASYALSSQTSSILSIRYFVHGYIHRQFSSSYLSAPSPSRSRQLHAVAINVKVAFGKTPFGCPLRIRSPSEQKTGTQVFIDIGKAPHRGFKHRCSRKFLHNYYD